jgi:DNA replication protein DnaC
MEPSSDRAGNTVLGERDAACETHGPFVSKGVRLNIINKEIWSQCPECASDREKAERRAEAEARAARERERLEGLIRASGIPARLKGCTFSTYNAASDGQKHALQVAMDYARDFRRHAKTGESLIFAGRPGTGKGHLAAAIMQALMPEHLPVYTTCLDMIRSVRDTWRKDSKYSESQVLQEYEDAELLIIDEIGVQYGTDGEQTVIFDVLDRRYRQMRPTVFITNQDRTGFTQFIGERSFDRLKQTAKWVAFDWASYRPTARKEQA